ncbi:MAG: TetR/AcrR family transcriptional regulator [Clostridiales bacterium]|nr:TetR/AcrR family transcriptional regulator [Clostridiales bacterium]
MSAVKKFSEEAIIKAALAIIKEGGMGSLNARSLAMALGSSTRPIYLAFGGMKGVKEAAIQRITRIYRGYLEREVKSGKYPEYKAYGMGYIRFAREEKEFFSYLFMRDRKGAEGYDGGDMEGVLSAAGKAAGLERSAAEFFHLEIWLFVHGIAAAIATSYADFDEETVQKMITDVFAGLKMKYASAKEN